MANLDIDSLDEVSNSVLQTDKIIFLDCSIICFCQDVFNYLLFNTSVKPLKRWLLYAKDPKLRKITLKQGNIPILIDWFCNFESIVTTLQKLDCFEELKQKSQEL